MGLKNSVRTESKNFGFKYGLTVAKHPIIGVIMIIALICAFGPGLLKLEITNDPDELWVNKDGTLYAEQRISDKNFNRFFRAEQVIFRPRDGSEDDMIRKDYLQEVFWFQEIAKRTVVNRPQKNWTIHDLCWSALPDSNCTIQTPLGFWQNNYTRLLQDKDLHYTTQCLNSIDPKNSLACMDETGIPVQTKVVFGGLTKVYQTRTTSSLGEESPFLSESQSCKQKLGTDILTDGEGIDKCSVFIYNAKALGKFY